MMQEILLCRICNLSKVFGEFPKHIAFSKASFQCEFKLPIVPPMLQSRVAMPVLQKLTTQIIDSMYAFKNSTSVFYALYTNTPGAAAFTYKQLKH
jgi:hypothetical protein